MNSNVSIFYRFTCAFTIIFKKPLPNPRSQRFVPVFSSKSFGVQIHAVACGYPIVPAPFVEKTILPSLDCLGTQRPFDHKCVSLYQVLSFIPLICITVLIPLPPSPDCYSFAVSFEVGKCKSSFLLFFFKIVLAILGPFYFYMNFRFGLSVSANRQLGF